MTGILIVLGCLMTFLVGVLVGIGVTLYCLKLGK